ncbi:MAG: hypothetical protein QM733_15335 [Ilumatobacteraceae bacterium]
MKPSATIAPLFDLNRRAKRRRPDNGAIAITSTGPDSARKMPSGSRS